MIELKMWFGASLLSKWFLFFSSSSYFSISLFHFQMENSHFVFHVLRCLCRPKRVLSVGQMVWVYFALKTEPSNDMTIIALHNKLNQLPWTAPKHQIDESIENEKYNLVFTHRLKCIELCAFQIWWFTFHFIRDTIKSRPNSYAMNVFAVGKPDIHM